MSFWSSLNFVRLGPPPHVTAAEMAAFFRDLHTADALDPDSSFECQIKYGARVDADERTTVSIEWNEAGLGLMTEYPWDQSETFPSLAQLADALAADRRSIYRAHVSLGVLKPEICEALTREPSAENELGLYLGELSFEVGPILVAGLASEAPAFVGWLALKISGPGYYFPWSFRQARERAESLEAVQRLAGACRKAWPIPAKPASAEAIAARQQLNELWLYDVFDRPTDWLWFASETG